jgi:hypothetical protein
MNDVMMASLRVHIVDIEELCRPLATELHMPAHDYIHLFQDVSFLAKGETSLLLNRWRSIYGKYLITLTIYLPQP